ncbi:MAG: PilZ protein [Sphingomonas bacterium]|uniref:hypothetical protein n=1 Tax=Sphingomonas bacterium TaxID=1895847 RepID=UPI00260BDF09|nr:hypothetical protein [Sphingomonas bacterium]MDB5706794.1 PilZ protein [Sphingomonas bacterium]
MQQYEIPPHQRRVDEIQSQARRDGVRASLFKPRPAASIPLAGAEDPLSRRLSEELGYVRRLLDAIGDRLVADPIVLQKHADILQSFDVVGQMIGHVADVVAAADRAAAVERIGMQDLRSRLKRGALYEHRD